MTHNEADILFSKPTQILNMGGPWIGNLHINDSYIIDNVIIDNNIFNIETNL